jgi:hypothetical protein
MAKARKSWSDKLATGEAEIVEVTADRGPYRAGQRMLISTPRAIDALVRAIPPGTGVDPATVREQLAAAAGADVTCPLTTGIFLRIVAEAANEAYQAGAAPSDITPVWRAIGPKMPIFKKLSFDPSWMLAERTREGIN